MRSVCCVVIAIAFMFYTLPANGGFWKKFKCPVGDVIEGATTPCGGCRGVVNDYDGYLYHLKFCGKHASAGYAAAVKVGRARVVGKSLGFGPTPCDGDGSECKKIAEAMGDLGKIFMPYCVLKKLLGILLPIPRNKIFIATYVQPIPPLPLKPPELPLTEFKPPYKKDACGRKVPTFWEVLLDSIPWLP